MAEEKLEILVYGNPKLREKSAPVEEGDPELLGQVEKMKELMYGANGIGLAAPQVGILKRFVLCDVEWAHPEEGQEPRPNLHVLINPEIVEESAEDEPFVEGCLSVPGIEGEVHRPLEITLRYQDLDFQWRTQRLDGLLARCAQHELDHLDGILFVDRMSFVKRKLLAGSLNRLKRNGPPAAE